MKNSLLVAVISRRTFICFISSNICSGGSDATAWVIASGALAGSTAAPNGDSGTTDVVLADGSEPPITPPLPPPMFTGIELAPVAMPPDPIMWPSSIWRVTTLDDGPPDGP